jgi:hypothetical protein
MKRLCLLFCFLFSSLLWAQVQGNSLAGSAEPVVRVGTEGFDAVLLKTIDCKRSRVGDPILARSMDDVQLKKGVLVPKNAKLIGHVQEVQVKRRGATESRIGIVFEKAQLADGKEFPLRLSILKIIAPDGTDTPPKDVQAIRIELDSSSGSQVLFLRSREDNIRVDSGAHLLLRVIGQ